MHMADLGLFNGADAYRPVYNCGGDAADCMRASPLIQINSSQKAEERGSERGVDLFHHHCAAEQLLLRQSGNSRYAAPARVVPKRFRGQLEAPVKEEGKTNESELHFSSCSEVAVSM